MQYLLHHHLRRAAQRYPGKVAVVDGERSITYEELDQLSDRVAGHLRSLGVRRGERVAFYLDKSIESVLAIYGILKSGAAYVPFDPDAPPARLAYIASNAGVRHLLTGVEKSERWPELISDGASLESLIVLNSDEQAMEGPVPVTPRSVIDATEPITTDVSATALDLAYILYTSGSTGDPKGVKLTHLNALAFVDWTVEEYGIGPDDRLSSHAPFHFDLSIFDLYAAAHAGATLVLVPSQASVFPLELKRFIEREAISVWYSVPSILTVLALRGKLEPGDLPSLRTILFAGEVFPTGYLRKLMGLLPHVRFSNLYGPTETNVCTYYDVPQLPEDRTAPISIGRAIQNVEVFVVDEGGSKLPAGEVGELWVRGPTVMQGYWGDDERTAKVLVPNSFDEGLSDPVYKTGDLARVEEDGDITLLGRKDSQIKSRGYRIELGDIEAALYAHPAVEECAVIPVPDEIVTNRIHAFVAVSGDVDQSELVRFAAARIPRYMIPERFEFREALPKTSTGKIDRRSLIPG